MRSPATGTAGQSAAAPTHRPKSDASKRNRNDAPSGEKKNSPPPARLPSPKLRLQANDLTQPSTKTFLTLFPDLNSVIQCALSVIVSQLYTSPHEEEHPQHPHQAPPPAPPVHFHPCIPGTRSVTFIIRDFPGVAHTTSIELDSDHKEIHLSLSYISKAKTYPDPGSELAGVLTHELVHCYQHTKPPPDHRPSHIPNPPSGLIEGLADFVRLKASLAPPHWKRPKSADDRSDRWDAGYQQTAYFLEWIEDVKVGKGAVGMLNDRLRTVGYIGEGEKARKENGCKDGFWVGLFGVGVLGLWDEYGKYLDGLKDKKGEKGEKKN